GTRGGACEDRGEQMGGQERNPRREDGLSFQKPRRTLAAAALLAAGTLVVGTCCQAADDVRQVTSEKLPNVPGKSITAIVVNYAPGAKSVKHHHTASARAHVLSGRSPLPNS